MKKKEKKMFSSHLSLESHSSRLSRFFVNIYSAILEETVAGTMRESLAPTLFDTERQMILPEMSRWPENND